MLRLYVSALGEVSLMVTVVPLSGVGAFCICTQKVSVPDGELCRS